MKMMPSILTLAAALTAAPDPALAALPIKPHILFVHVDDYANSLHAQLLADASNPIPDIKALKTGGVEFVRAMVTQSVCGPSRSSFLTGQYSWNHGVNCNIGPCVGGASGGFESLIDRTNTLQKWVQAAGYRTGLWGKLPNGYGIDAGQPPSDVRSPLHVVPYWDNFTALVGNSTYLSYGYTLNENGVLTTYPWPSHQTRTLGTKAATWIAANKATGPLFVYLAPVAPHFTFDTQLGPSVGDYSDIWDVMNLPDIGIDPVLHPTQWTAVRSLPFSVATKNSFNLNNPISSYSHLAMTTMDKGQADDQFQFAGLAMLAVNDAVKAAVAAFGLDPVVVIFTADNGYKYGEDRSGGKQGAKNEDAFVPLLVRVYNAPAPFIGQRQELVLNNDLAATVTEIAGGVVGRVQDGRSLVPLINGLTPATWRKRAALDHHETPTMGGVPDLKRYRAVRTWLTDALPGRLLIDWLLTGECELYDGTTATGAADPWQTVNKCVSKPGEKATLAAYLAALDGCSGAACATAEGF